MKKMILAIAMLMAMGMQSASAATEAEFKAQQDSLSKAYGKYFGLAKTGAAPGTGSAAASRSAVEAAVYSGRTFWQGRDGRITGAGNAGGSFFGAACKTGNPGSGRVRPGEFLFFR